jgi:cyclopropane-fatty-acyl-phospholipid synthase
MLMTSGAQAQVEQLLGAAGITVNGRQPYDIQVRNPRMFGRVLAGGDLGLAESYMDGDWDADAVDQVVDRLFHHDVDRKVPRRPTDVFQLAIARFFSRQSRSRVRDKVAPHYNLGNDLFERILDTKYMAYTCAYWRDGAQTLEEAQTAKFDLLCRKLGLARGMKVLDIGCGWGSFAKHAAENYGVSVTGVSLSKEQVSLGMARNKGLPVDLRVQDYRDVTGTFDRVVSIGCLEHIGHKNHRRFFQTIHDRLAPGGHAVVHAIGVAKTEYRAGGFLDTYVFPLVNLPSIAQVGAAIDGLFILDDLQNIGTDYDRTLMEWNERFQREWPALAPTYGPMLDGRFKRMFEFYLLGCAGFVRSRRAQVWHFVLTPPNQPQPVCRFS